MENIIISVIIIAIINAAIIYIVKEKKKGRKCIGCSSAAGACAGSCFGNVQKSDTEDNRI